MGQRLRTQALAAHRALPPAARFWNPRRRTAMMLGQAAGEFVFDVDACARSPTASARP
jgi:hypothetical protein